MGVKKYQPPKYQPVTSANITTKITSDKIWKKDADYKEGRC